MANHRRQWASWQTFHPVHPMEDLMPGGVRLPDPDEQPPDPIYAFLEVFEELYGDQFPPHVLLYDSGDPNGGDDMEESDDDVDGGGESLSAIVYGGGRLHPSRRPSVPPPEERPRGWMPCPAAMAMPTPRPPNKGWREKGRPDGWQRFYLDRGAGRHAASEAEPNRELWIAFLLDRGAAKSTSWWRSFERRFERCAAADPYYAAGDTPCAMVTSFTFCFQ
uniref:Uncharacterized protein n=1 Tax=Oryza nivara TaxID=4536 RepID=A0A0E0IUN6_ORYNI